VLNLIELQYKWKSYLIKAGLILASLAIVYGIAVVRTNAACQVTQATAIVKGVKENEKTKQEVRRLSTSDLDKRLSRWVQPE